MVEVEAPPAGGSGECPQFSGVNLTEKKQAQLGGGCEGGGWWWWGGVVGGGGAKVTHSGVLRNSPVFLEQGQVIPLSHVKSKPRTANSTATACSLLSSGSVSSAQPGSHYG